MGGGGSTCRLSVKISLHCQLSVKMFDLCRLSELSVNLSYFFLSLVGNFFLVLSVVSNIFSPFVASRLTPFTPSSKHLEVLQKNCDTRRIFGSLLRLWKCDQTLSVVFDILLN